MQLKDFDFSEEESMDHLSCKREKNLGNLFFYRQNSGWQRALAVKIGLSWPLMPLKSKNWGNHQFEIKDFWLRLSLGGHRAPKVKTAIMPPVIPVDSKIWANLAKNENLIICHRFSPGKSHDYSCNWKILIFSEVSSACKLGRVHGPSLL